MKARIILTNGVVIEIEDGTPDEIRRAAETPALPMQPVFPTQPTFPTFPLFRQPVVFPTLPWVTGDRGLEQPQPYIVSNGCVYPTVPVYSVAGAPCFTASSH